MTNPTVAAADSPHPNAPALADDSSTILKSVDAASIAASDPNTGTALPGPTPTKTAKASNAPHRRNKAEQAALEIRKLHFGAVNDKDLWLLDGERGGFAQVPRTLALISEVIIKNAVKNKTGVSSAAGSTYSVLWLRTQGQGISKVDNEADAALEAGYGGERGVSTFRKHIRVLRDLGFIDYVEESRGRVKWILMLNPYLVTKQLHAAGYVAKTHYAALIERAAAIGSSGELKEPDHVE